MRQGMGGRQWGTEWDDFKHFHCCRDLLKLYLKRSNQDLKDYLIVDGKIFFARKWISDNEAEDPSLRQLSFDIWNLIKFSICTLLLPKHLSCSSAHMWEWRIKSRNEFWREDFPMMLLWRRRRIYFAWILFSSYCFIHFLFFMGNYF